MFFKIVPEDDRSSETVKNQFASVKGDKGDCDIILFLPHLEQRSSECT